MWRGPLAKGALSGAAAAPAAVPLALPTGAVTYPSKHATVLEDQEHLWLSASIALMLLPCQAYTGGSTHMRLVPNPPANCYLPKRILSSPKYCPCRSMPYRMGWTSTTLFGLSTSSARRLRLGVTHGTPWPQAAAGALGPGPTMPTCDQSWRTMLSSVTTLRRWQLLLLPTLQLLEARMRGRQRWED